LIVHRTFPIGGPLTPKGQTRDPNTNMLNAQYLENRCRCYLATIAMRVSDGGGFNVSTNTA